MPLLQLLLICSAVAWHMSAGAAAVLDSNFTTAPQCHPPPWSVPGPSLTLDRLLATKGADRLIKAGKAAEAVRRLRRALSPAAAASVDRWKAAPHAALRAALGRALMASEPDKPANAFAQFVAAKRLELGENPLHVFLPNDAAECVLKRRPPPPPVVPHIQLFNMRRRIRVVCICTQVRWHNLAGTHNVRLCTMRNAFHI